MREMEMRMVNDVKGNMRSSEDVEGGLEVRRIDLCRRFVNAMPAARDIDDFCKKSKSGNWDKCLNNEVGIPETTVRSV